MGQCISVQNDLDSGNKYLQPSRPGLQDFPVSSPLKEKSLTVEFTKFDHHISRTRSYTYGGEKEAFFDTQPWLDSDCEDDFYSINGDLTPSSGSTPVHQSFASMEIRLSNYCNSSVLASPTPGPSPNARKKSLSDLFEESGRYVTEANQEMILGLPNESAFASAIGSPCLSGARSSYTGQMAAEGNDVVRKVRSFKSAKCCIPQLLLSPSFGNKKGQKKELHREH